MDISHTLKYNPIRNFLNYRKYMKPLFTTLPEAVSEMQRRRQDPDLFKRVQNFLGSDIPRHFDRVEPIFYLSRHVATPNFETLKVFEMVKDYDFPLVIGEDQQGIFVSSNSIKVTLGKLPILKGYDKNKNEIIQNFTVVNFNESQGKSFKDITTTEGCSLTELHHKLLKYSPLKHTEFADESAWIDKHHRGDLYKQYVHILSLQCVHGILFESFFIDEYEFARDIVGPAFKEVEKNIGVRPLIVEHINHKEELQRTWDAYPASVEEAFSKLNK